MGDQDLDAERVPLRLVASWPAAGEGLDCAVSDPGCGIPSNVGVELRFDRPLLPVSATRPSVRLWSGDPERREGLTPVYDPLERVVAYRPLSGELERGVVYTLEVLAPDTEDGPGFRAFDGSPLEAEGSAPLRLSFRTALAAPVPGNPPPPVDCVRLRFLFLGSCVGAQCHGEGGRMGLDLSPNRIEFARGRVAHQTMTGAPVNAPLVDPPRFGTQMAVLSPGRPDDSYLFYKLLVNPENFVPRAGSCASPYRVPLVAGAEVVQCAPALEEAEAGRLRAWFVRGLPMPLRPAPPEAQKPPLRRDDLELVQRWIRAGAPVEDCLR